MPKANVLVRKLHYWVSISIAVPALILLGSGILLQTKKHWSWVQPAEHRGTGTAPQVSLDDVLRTLIDNPAVGVRGWDDVNRIDVRPGRGVAKVWLHSGWEAQVDLGTGRLLHHAYRRSDLIESIHDGSLFGGDLTKLGIFLPTGIALLFLWVTGIWLFVIPIIAKRRRAAAER